MERRAYLPGGNEKRVRAIRMANVVEKELQRQRNMAKVGIPVTEAVQVLWRKGEIIARRVAIDPQGESS